MNIIATCRHSFENDSAVLLIGDEQYFDYGYLFIDFEDREQGSNIESAIINKH